MIRCGRQKRHNPLVRGTEDDFRVACARMKRGDYRHGISFAYSAVEKMLRAHVAKITGDVPVESQTPVRLAQQAQLRLSREQEMFLVRLCSWQVEGRIMDDDELEPISAELAQSILSDTEDTLQWLMHKL